MRTWFAVENSLVDRNDLTAYEKLCGMVLARYAGRPEFDHLLTTDIIAVKMGVPSELAMNALRGLVRKGLVDVESASDLFVEGSENHIKDIELAEYKDEKDTHIIRSYSDKDSTETMKFETLDLDNEFVDEEDGFDTLDKLIAESHAGGVPESISVNDEAYNEVNSNDVKSKEPNKTTEEANANSASNQTSGKTSLPYNRGVSSYQNVKNMKTTDKIEYDVNQVSDTAEEVDEEVLSKSIHEQSDSVRAWIEESEPVAPPVAKAPVTNRETLVTELIELIEEPINDRQARIILGLAEYDLEKVRKCYSLAQNTQVSDKIDMLIHELQKKDDPEVPKRTPKTSQVDHARLNQMKKYQAMKSKAGSNI